MPAFVTTRRHGLSLNLAADVATEGEFGAADGLRLRTKAAKMRDSISPVTF